MVPVAVLVFKIPGGIFALVLKVRVFGPDPLPALLQIVRGVVGVDETVVVLPVVCRGALGGAVVDYGNVVDAAATVEVLEDRQSLDVPGPVALGGVNLEAEIKAAAGHLLKGFIQAVVHDLPAPGVEMEQGEQLQGIGQHGQFGQPQLLFPFLVSGSFRRGHDPGHCLDAHFALLFLFIVVDARYAFFIHMLFAVLELLLRLTVEAHRPQRVIVVPPGVDGIVALSIFPMPGAPVCRYCFFGHKSRCRP